MLPRLGVGADRQVVLEPNLRILCEVAERGRGNLAQTHAPPPPTERRSRSPTRMCKRKRTGRDVDALGNLWGLALCAHELCAGLGDFRGGLRLSQFASHMTMLFIAFADPVGVAIAARRSALETVRTFALDRGALERIDESVSDLFSCELSLVDEWKSALQTEIRTSARVSCDETPRERVVVLVVS